MTEAAQWLIDLISRVPVLHVDVAAAHKAGDDEAATYSRAMAEWRAEAALAVSEASQAVETPLRQREGCLRTDQVQGDRPHGYPSLQLVADRDFTAPAG